MSNSRQSVPGTAERPTHIVIDQPQEPTSTAIGKVVLVNMVVPVLVAVATVRLVMPMTLRRRLGLFSDWSKCSICSQLRPDFFLKTLKTYHHPPRWREQGRPEKVCRLCSLECEIGPLSGEGSLAFDQREYSFRTATVERPKWIPLRLWKRGSSWWALKLKWWIIGPQYSKEIPKD